MTTPRRLLPFLIVPLAAVSACASGRVVGSGDRETAPAAEEVSFGGASFTLPDGWSVTVPEGDGAWTDIDPMTGSAAEHSYRTLCVGPDPAECGLRMYHGDAPGHEGFQGWEDRGAWPWYTSTDVDTCPVREPGGGFDAVQPVGGDYLPAETGTRPAGARTAVCRRWDAVCEASGFTFSPRSWHLPESDIVVIDALRRPETESVLASFRFE